MTIEDFKGVSGTNYSDIVTKIKNQVKPKAVEDFITQLDVKKHPVMDTSVRKMKEKVTEGPTVNGIKTTKTEYVDVARLPVSLQKTISSRAAAFLCGNPVKRISNPQDSGEELFLETLNYLWDKLKLDYKMLTLALDTCQETECALLFYWLPVGDDLEYWGDSALQGNKTKMRCRILANSSGDTLYPIFDATGDMIAFGREYTVTSGSDTEQHFDLYLPTTILKGVQVSGGWTAIPEANPFGEIPIVYFSQPVPEWYDVEALIERLETALSNNADTVDYNGSPILKLRGKVKGFAEKGDGGKAVQLEGEHADASYLEMNQSADIIENEKDMLLKLIHYLTDTPNISFDEMKSLGHFSIISLRMLFIAPHLKASMKAGGGFGESTQRIINFLKNALGKLDIQKFGKASTMAITPEFDYFLPKNVQEVITYLTDSVPGKAIMSQETAIRLNPLVENPDEEIEKMKAEGAFASDIQAD